MVVAANTIHIIIKVWTKVKVIYYFFLEGKTAIILTGGKMSQGKIIAKKGEDLSGGTFSLLGNIFFAKVIS